MVIGLLRLPQAVITAAGNEALAKLAFTGRRMAIGAMTVNNALRANLCIGLAVPMRETSS
jgi:hypothetical protein